jgi:SAM-dependent methyltransferase
LGGESVLKDSQDAYGHELFDRYNGVEATEIVETDNGRFDVAGATSGYFTEFAEWRPIYRKAMRLVKGKVLDIGCGAGRHSIHLQGKGFDVLGIDISPLAVKVSRLRGLKKARVMSVTQVTRSLGTFDTILMLGCNFGLFANPKRANWLLRRFKGITTKNARIIAETKDPYKTTDPHHLEYHEFNRKRGRLPGQLRIRIRYKKYVIPFFEYLMVSKNELETILEGTGWSVGKYLDSDSSVYIAVIEKDN